MSKSRGAARDRWGLEVFAGCRVEIRESPRTSCPAILARVGGVAETAAPGGETTFFRASSDQDLTAKSVVVDGGAVRHS